MNFEVDVIDVYDDMVNALTGMGSYNFLEKKLDLDLKIKWPRC